ncbi:hypothetical protein AB0B85_17315 [Micromonospora sp. NPDC049044]
MHGVSRLWMDGVLDAAVTAAAHIDPDHLTDHYLRLRESQQRARDEEAG